MIIETERLEFHEFNLNDVDFIVKLLNSPGWIKYIGDRGVKTVEDAAEYLINGPMNSYKKNGFGLWLVKLKATGESIGMCGLIKRDYLDDVDIGYAFLPEQQGKGYAFEATKAILNSAKNDYKLKRLVAIISKDNASSIKLIKKLGFHFEKMFFIPNDAEELVFYGTNNDFSS